VLNVDDPVVVSLSERARGPIISYGSDPERRAPRRDAAQSTFWTVRDDTIGYERARQWRGIAPLGALSEPSGPHAHDVSSALGAAALAHALRLPEAAIADALCALEGAVPRVEQRA
jgi:UDP-N-acetylmuramyl tripeptide synthase